MSFYSSNIGTKLSRKEMQFITGGLLAPPDDSGKCLSGTMKCCDGSGYCTSSAPDNGSNICTQNYTKVCVS